MIEMNRHTLGAAVQELMMLVSAFISLWVFIAWIACGVFSAYVAAHKNRCIPCWFVWGLLFGPLALLAIVGVPVRILPVPQPVIGHDGKLILPTRGA